MKQRLGDRGYLDVNLWVPKHFFNIEGVKNALTFPYVEGKDRTPAELHLCIETDHHLIVPREFWPHGNLGFEIVDCRPQEYTRTRVRSRIQLDHKINNAGEVIPTGDTVQQESLHALLSSRGGILQLACGKGKTVIFLEAIARMQVPALIVVDNTQLLAQWRESIERFLDVPGGIGLIQGEVNDWKKAVVLATYQTLAARSISGAITESMRRWFGLIGWDEAHHVNAPTFSRSADMFYGKRIGLTATPEREDGLHIIHEFNFGRVFYRNLKQDMVPKISFVWTGLSLDENDAAVQDATRDTTNELHLSKIASFFGTWEPRLEQLSAIIDDRAKQGRKVLVLSNSIGELVNLLARRLHLTEKITDIRVSPQDVGETLEPIELDKNNVATLREAVSALQKREAQLSAAERQKLNGFLQALKHHEVFEKMQKLFRKREREFIDHIVAKIQKSDSGLMIYKVKANERMRLLKEKQVVFAVMKYGKEGLDKPTLESVLCCEPVSSKNVLQQVMGRPLRYKEGKQEPEIIIVEDDIAPIRAICAKMRKHLRRWPIEDGGPFKYEQVGYPPGRKTK